MARDHTVYGGETITPFTVLSRLQVTQQGVRQLTFDTFESVASFDAGGNPIPRLQINFVPTAEEMQPYAELLDAIRSKALEILGLGGLDYTLTNLYISTIDKVLEISAVSAADDDRPTDAKSGAAYDATIAANQDLVTEALTVAWTFGKTNDAFLAAMAAV